MEIKENTRRYFHEYIPMGEIPIGMKNNNIQRK